ncbi:hypothetical protein ACP4OV_026478 [Aristida adscensionis]
MGVLVAAAALVSLLLTAPCGAGAAPAPAPASPPSPSSSPPGCPTSCGRLSFGYPFGVGEARCFLGRVFELFCNRTTGESPRLFLNDGVTEVTDSINLPSSHCKAAGALPPSPILRRDQDRCRHSCDLRSIFSSMAALLIAFSLAIPLIPGVSSYNASWAAPGLSFTGADGIDLRFIACDLDVYYLLDDRRRAKLCEVTGCPNQTTATDFAGVPADGELARCTGVAGCCTASVDGRLAVRLQLVVVRDGGGGNSSVGAVQVTGSGALQWGLPDQPTCAAACVSNYSHCVPDGSSRLLYPPYLCVCNASHAGGNPYVADGCPPPYHSDHEYNPGNNKCGDQRCGSIDVPFPFSLEEGCAGREEFMLTCTGNTTLTSSMFGITNNVTYINISHGVMVVSVQPSDVGFVETSPLSVTYPSSEQQLWVVATLTCQDAVKNRRRYACVAKRSTCYGVNNLEGEYLGYRCACEPGFDGNPYVHDGCQDVNECTKYLGICQWSCHNTVGNYSCSKCPDEMEYDTRTMQCAQMKRKTSPLTGMAIGFGAGFGTLLLGLSATILVHRWRREVDKRLRRKHFMENQGLLLEQLISSNENASDKTKIFSLEELEKATNNFDHTRILGRGGHGMVYKGILSDQHVVAIKKSKIIEQSEIKEFINEVAILSQISHRNIVRLFGCCLETKVPLLVYDFVPNGSLFQALHSTSNNGFVLSWDDCLRIAMEAAGALCYLHSAASISVFHRDVKSSNILLDANYMAKVSDFGASRSVTIDQTHVVTLLQGTFGYLDPEYYHTGELNEKSDVYSFGVVLLELLLRKEAVFTNESGLNQNLASYFRLEFKARPIIEIVAAQVLEEATEEEIVNVASLAEMCLRLQGEERPTMKEVEMLQTIRTKRLMSCRLAFENDGIVHQLLCSRAKDTTNQSFAQGDYSMDQASQRRRSLEQEFLSIAELPRYKHT